MKMDEVRTKSLLDVCKILIVLGEKSIDIFEKCKIFYAKPLLIGTLDECLKYDYHFQTNIPKWENVKV